METWEEVMTYTPRKTVPVIERLMRRVSKDKAGCWIFTGHCDRNGYGQINLGRRPPKLKYTHVVAYEFTKGSVPSGYELDHLCRQPACCTPEHLEAVTHRENMSRGAPATKTHCKRGHAFTEENTYLQRGRHGTQRRCCTCYRAYMRRYHRRVR